MVEYEFKEIIIIISILLKICYNLIYLIYIEMNFIFFNYICLFFSWGEYIIFISYV